MQLQLSQAQVIHVTLCGLLFLYKCRQLSGEGGMGTLQVPEDLKLQLVAIGSPIRSARNAILFQRGDPVTGVFLITTGAAELRLDEKPTALPTQYAGPGSVLGLPAALSNMPYSLTAQVVEEAELVFIPRDKLMDLLRSQPQLCFRVMGILTEEITQTRAALERVRTLGAKAASFH